MKFWHLNIMKKNIFRGPNSGVFKAKNGILHAKVCWVNKIDPSGLFHKKFETPKRFGVIILVFKQMLFGA